MASIKSWRTLGGFFEGLLLLVLGVYMLLFAMGDAYWTLLNPKFKWVTGSAGVGLMVVGGVVCFSHNRPNLSRILAFVFLLGLFTQINKQGLMVSPEPEMNFVHNEIPAPLIGTPSEKEGKAEPSRSIKNGMEYIKINTGELYDICEVGTDEQRAQRYHFRGIVQKDESLSAKGQFVVLRPSVACCLADSVSVGFLVQSADHASYKTGQWVNVYGPLVSASGSTEELDKVGIKGIFFTAIHSNYLLKADVVEETAPPEVPIIFDFRSQEPYAF